MMTVSTLLLIALLAPPPQGSDRRAEAERLAAAGSHAAALARFQEIAAANPDDIEARVWIGRLHATLGHPQRAIDVFRSVLAVEPRHVRTLIELGGVLTTTGRHDEARTALDRAEAVAPDDPAVLSAQGRLHAAAGQRELSRAYFLRAEALQPGNPEAREGSSALRAANAHRIEAAYVFEDFNRDVSATHAGDLTLNARVNDALRVFVTGQRQRKFSQIENRGGGGVEWAVRRNLRVRAGSLFASDTIVLPRGDAFASVDADAGRATWTFMGRYAQFDAARFWAAGPGVLVRLPRGLDVQGSYFRSQTRPEAGDPIGVNSGSVGLSAAVSSRARVTGTYTRGIDHLEWLTADRLGPFTANTWSAALDVRASRLLSFALAYDYQDRPDAVRVHRAGVRLTQRF